MSDLEERICRILRKRFHCLCGKRPLYCSSVSDILNLILEKCEEEHVDDVSGET